VGDGFILWEHHGPKVHISGNLTEEDITRQVAARSFNEKEGQLKKSLFAYFLNELPVGDAVVMKDMSSSADIIIKLRSDIVMEIQAKNTKDTVLDRRKLVHELKKSIVFLSPLSGISSIFVYLSVNLNTPETLILEGGRSYRWGSWELLPILNVKRTRKSSKVKDASKSAKKSIEFRADISDINSDVAIDDTYFEDDVITSTVPGDIIEIPQGMTLVIPSLSGIRSFLGPSIFSKLASKSTEVSSAEKR
jgi:hypothetical protein